MSSLGNFFASIKAKASTKKTAVVILIALCILLPTVFALANAVYTDLKSSAPTVVPSVVIYDVDGKELFSETQDAESYVETSLVSIFLSIRSNMEKVSSIPDGYDKIKPLKVKITEGSVITELTCYFSFTHGESYCVDNDGKFYRIPDSYSDYFLASPFAEPLYDTAVPPSLMTADELEIVPSTADWIYVSTDGTERRSVLTKTASSVQSYDISGRLALSFMSAPSVCVVNVYENSRLVFTGTLEQLSNATLDTEAQLHISVSAKWNKANGADCYGTMTYDFEVIIHNKAEFYLSSDTLKKDGFTVLKATNISEPSRFDLSLPDGSYIPTVTYVGDTAYAAIPYPHSFDGEVYPISVSYGVSSCTFNVSLDTLSTPCADDINATLDALDVDRRIFEVGNVQSIFLGHTVIQPTEKGYVQTGALSDSKTLGGKDVVSLFNEYTVVGGSAMPVCSTMGGKICYVGSSATLGKIVVTDCGLGIKLWYFNLSTVDVNVGDLVSAGQVLGKTAALENKMDGFYILASCGDNVIDPSVLFELQMTFGE
jgi:hypothetical protein